MKKCFLILSILIVGYSYAQQESLKNKYVITNDVVLPKEKAPIKVDHSPWDKLAKEMVTADGKVNYKGVKEKLPELTKYLKHLELNAPKDNWVRNDRLAYWINLYNASTVYLVAVNYPVKSIKSLYGGKPWDQKFIKTGKQVYSLNQVENDIIRPLFKDPRIHAALNCASGSCPNLLNGAYTPNTLDKQLDEQTTLWINDPTKNDVSEGNMGVSKVFEWYESDFKAAGGVKNFVEKYSKKDSTVKSKKKVKFLDYDWTLNE